MLERRLIEGTIKILIKNRKKKKEISNLINNNVNSSMDE